VTVTTTDHDRQLYARLAGLLAYPHADPTGPARDALALLGGGPGHEPLARFASATAAAGLHGMQELYTATFDLRPVCAPYLGAQLLPEDSPIRGRLLAALLELYEAEGYRPGVELADHVAEVVGFLAAARPAPAHVSLVVDGLLPALDRMVAALDGAGNPYRDLLAAVRAALAPPSGRVGVERGGA
jgi:nitrate reductase molybdenum cofactor assembly chaperone NarJ/NarW